MALFTFFSINFPYGIRKDSQGNWATFNREYVPLGYNTTDLKELNNMGLKNGLIFTSYTGMTERKLKTFFVEEDIKYNHNGKIETIWFYNDGTDPNRNPKYWEEYFNKLKFISQFRIDEYCHIGF